MFFSIARSLIMKAVYTFASLPMKRLHHLRPRSILAILLLLAVPERRGQARDRAIPPRCLRHCRSGRCSGGTSMQSYAWISPDLPTQKVCLGAAFYG